MVSVLPKDQSLQALTSFHMGNSWFGDQQTNVGEWHVIHTLSPVSPSGKGQPCGPPIIIRYQKIYKKKQFTHTHTHTNQLTSLLCRQGRGWRLWWAAGGHLDSRLWVMNLPLLLHPLPLLPLLHLLPLLFDPVAHLTHLQQREKAKKCYRGSSSYDRVLFLCHVINWFSA